MNHELAIDQPIRPIKDWESGGIDRHSFVMKISFFGAWLCSTSNRSLHGIGWRIGGYPDSMSFGLETLLRNTISTAVHGT
jgi:hypothetical protein